MGGVDEEFRHSPAYLVDMNISHCARPLVFCNLACGWLCYLILQGIAVCLQPTASVLGEAFGCKGAPTVCLHSPVTLITSRTDAADRSNIARSSSVSLISMICSTPLAPSLTGTPI